MKAVIFDMDGVIIDSESIADKLLTETAKKFGAELTGDEIESLHGASSIDFWKYVKEKYNLPHPVTYYRSQYPRSKEIELYKTIEPIPGILELLQNLHEHKVKLALATSASKERMVAAIKIFKLEQFFSVTICSDDVTHTKPNPELFLISAKKLRVENSSCVVIEDSLRGIQAAKTAGMKCILYQKQQKSKDKITADLIVKDLRTLNYERILNLID